MNSYKISRVPVVGGGKRERRTPFSQRVDELADNLKGFFAYNPGYEQEGPMQIAVSARVDEGTYQYAPDKYAENILVSKTPRKGADFLSQALAHPVFPAAETSATLPLFPNLLCLEKWRRLLLQALAQQRRTACCQKGGRGSGLDNRPGRRHGAARRFQLVSFPAGRRSEFAGQNQVLLG